MKRIFLFIIGAISVTLATIGMFLPILPTTPFLLLAAFCFLRSSDWAHDKLMTSRLFGTYLYNYERHQISKKHRRRTLIVLYLGIAFSIWKVQNTAMTVVLVIVAIGVTWHLFSLKGIE